MKGIGCLPPHPTGRADFPHPAVPESLTIGMRKELHDVASQHHQAEVLAMLIHRHAGWSPVTSLAPLLGLLAELLSQTSEFRRQRGPSTHLRRVGTDLPLFRSGMQRIQAALSSSHKSVTPAGLLRSTGITPLPRYYEPRRLPTGAAHGVMVSPAALGVRPTPPGLPGSSIDLSTPAVSNHPGGVRPLHAPVASRPILGFPTFGSLATPQWCHEAESSSLALRLTSSPPEASSAGLLRPTLGWLHVKRAITW